MSSKRIYIPREYYKLKQFVTIGADVMFMVGVPFFVAYSRKIKFAMSEFLLSRTKEQLATSLKKNYICTHVGALLTDYEPRKDNLSLLKIECLQ